MHAWQRRRCQALYCPGFAGLKPSRRCSGSENAAPNWWVCRDAGTSYLGPATIGIAAGGLGGRSILEASGTAGPSGHDPEPGVGISTGPGEAT